MANQMELMMQLYMMNLLQQQQQQQQQQQFQQQQPQQLSAFDYTQKEDISSSTCLQQQPQYEQPYEQQYVQQQQQPQQQYLRTLKRTNSQNTNCSSSRSCSPNSNLNALSTQQQYEQQATTTLITPTTTPNNNFNTNVAYQLPQMLLGTLSPLAQYVLQQQQQQQLQQQQQHLLTTAAATTNLLLTPNTPSSTQQQMLLEPFPSSPLKSVVEPFTTNNFLQSSTVTSTPTEDAAAAAATTTAATVAASRNLSAVTVKYEQDFNDDDEDEKPLSSLNSCSSSVGLVSTNDHSASTEKLILVSGVQQLESTSTTDSNDSPSMYTPVKQPADSSYNVVNSIDNEPTLGTPLGQSNSLLTPPASSDQPQSKSIVSLTTATSLDAFLQNEENLKHLRKVSSYLECENVLCRQETLREHFHCYDEPCQGKILSKKDDIIRHLKWHKKRKESLKLGFARFSSGDDCSASYGEGCAYNWKQTHYHCVYEHCPKVYVSTSDVQMHANFHRKDSEIVNEGFRRFRAHENCRIEDCPFFGKKISHYHCCREGCNHTFKNKADMDKHKTYHAKDYQLTQDGFKKILKTEQCPFDGCKFSTVSNHIHCVREHCNYILHSSSQMISHKRKHDRQDSEQAYQQFKCKQEDAEESNSMDATTPQSLSKPQPIVSQPVISNSSTSTPLSSLSAEHFLARKRGRPPKMIPLPADAQSEAKRVKLENVDSNPTALLTTNVNPLATGMFPGLLPNFPADATAPNFQLTHLMAMFQLQNPLFYQNLYPGAAAASNMLTVPQNANVLNNLAAYSAAAAAAAAGVQQPKIEFNIKPENKE
ncbi:hypothetical protein KR215_000170 [Drosophila sulfurigaster]|nr:hypothetical protein KR215_000170 [Drosophila sulfurigaster]